MVLFKDFSSFGKKYLVVTKESNDTKEADISMLIERPIIGRFAERWPELKDSSDIIEWTYDVSRNFDSSSRAWSLHSPFHKNTTESRYLMTLVRRIILGGTRWGTLFKINGDWSYIPLYWEWLEDVLFRSRQTLNKAHIYDAVSASLYTYDWNADVMQAFCKGWCPQTNTLYTSLGEMFISLWDLYRLGGLPIFGHLYDEAIPCCEE